MTNGDSLIKLLQLPGYDPLRDVQACSLNPEAAQLRLDFFPEILQHTLNALEISVVGNLFGWRKPDGTRRYHSVFMEGRASKPLVDFITELVLCGIFTYAESGDSTIRCSTREATTMAYERLTWAIFNAQEVDDRTILDPDRAGAVLPGGRVLNIRMNQRLTVGELHAEVRGGDPLTLVVTGSEREPSALVAPIADQARLAWQGTETGVLPVRWT